MYIRVLAQNPEKLRRFCEKQIDLAIAGDVQAAKEITDRVEGKAVQSLDVSDSRESSEDRRKEIMDLLRKGAERINIQ
jgi:regulator of sigma D